jgi:hypothetical protein
MIMAGENRRTWREASASITLFITNPTWCDPGVNAGLRVERPAINRLNHETVKQEFLSQSGPLL